MCVEVTAVDGSVAYFKQWTKFVLAYNSTNNKWSELPKCPNFDFNHMATPRSRYLVAVLPHNEFMVVGGLTPDSSWTGTDSVEVASIVR